MKTFIRVGVIIIIFVGEVLVFLELMQLTIMRFILEPSGPFFFIITFYLIATFLIWLLVKLSMLVWRSK